MNAVAETTPALVAVPLEQIALGKNYRHRRPANWEEKLDELGASMKQNGQLEPVLLRPTATAEEAARKKPPTFEIVFGERRYRAAKKAGLETLLAIVRDVADDQVLDLQLAENDDRDDPHPLDEAEAFAELVKRGRTPAEIAALRGRDVGYVAKRLKLAGLSKKCCAALDSEEITLGVALLLAKLPNHKLQDAGLDEVSTEGHGRIREGLMTVNDARKTLEANVMLALKTAPFKKDDAALVPKAGTCTTCPKRTGNQLELYEDASSTDLCTDPLCFREKVDALWQIRSKSHKAAGGEVLNQADTKALLGHVWDSRAHEVRSRYKKLDEREYSAGKSKTVRQLFKGELPPIVLAKDPDSGMPVELVAAAAVRKALGADKPERKVDPRTQAANRRERLKDLARTEATRRATEAIVQRIEHVKAWEQLGTKLLLPFARCVIEATWHDGRSALVKRRGWDKEEEAEGMRKPKKKGNPARGVIRERDMTALLLERLKELRPAELAGVIVELVISRGAPAKYSGEPGDEWAALAESLGVKYEAQLATVVNEQAVAEKAKGSKSPKKRKAAR